GITINDDGVRGLGMLPYIHDAETRPRDARALARQECKGPADALAMSKRMLNLSLDSDYAAMANMEAASQAVAMSTDFHADAVQRYKSRERKSVVEVRRVG